MIRIALIALIATTAAHALAETKAESCRYQADVVAAVQAARVERVSERRVEAHVLASAPEWPEKYNRVIPLVTPWVYEQTRAIIRNEDLGAAWNELCLQQ